MNLKILYEDADMIAVEKPQGMPAQPDKTGDLDMLTCLEKQCQMPLGLVHRLDRPVGGVMVFAKRTSAQVETQIAKAMQIGGWSKTYLAVVMGEPEQTKGTWTDYLFRDSRSNTSKVVDAKHKQAKKAILQYEVLDTIQNSEETLSLLKIQLQTGRHHQIRVQCAHHGVPIWGDRKYGNTRQPQQTGHIALWSYELKGQLPKKKPFCIHSIPQEKPFLYFVEILRKL